MCVLEFVCVVLLYSDESDMYDDPEASQKICQLEVFIVIVFYLEVKDFAILEIWLEKENQR